MKQQLLMLLVGMTLILTACDKDCDADTLAPGRYTDDCACDDGGVNFHGECIASDTRVFAYSYEKLCNINLAVVLPNSSEDRCTWQFDLDERMTVIKKCGPSRPAGTVITSSVDCPNAETEGFNVSYIYTVPEPNATELDIEFSEVTSPAGEEIDRYTVTVPLM